MKLYTCIVFLYSLLLTGCQWMSDDDSPDTIKVHRYDKLQEDYLTSNSFSALQKMNTDYPLETKYLLEDVLEIGKVDDADIHIKLREYYADPALVKLDKDAIAKFEDMSKIEKALSKGFMSLKKYIPSQPIPLVYSQLSALNQSVVVGDSIVGFSIDKYMGADYPLYKQLFYNYQSRYMESSRIAPDCIVAYLTYKYQFEWSGNHSLLRQMMYYGKIHWVAARALGMSIDEEIGYSKFETAWAIEHKDRVWNFLISSKQIESTDPMIIRTYLSLTPYTRYFGEKSPNRLGLWLGVHFVDDYMRKHPDVTVEALLNDDNYAKLFNEAQK